MSEREQALDENHPSHLWLFILTSVVSVSVVSVNIRLGENSRSSENTRLSEDTGRLSESNRVKTPRLPIAVIAEHLDCRVRYIYIYIPDHVE